jgi:hypothetical protein
MNAKEIATRLQEIANLAKRYGNESAKEGDTLSMIRFDRIEGELRELLLTLAD